MPLNTAFKEKGKHEQICKERKRKEAENEKKKKTNIDEQMNNNDIFEVDFTSRQPQKCNSFRGHPPLNSTMRVPSWTPAKRLFFCLMTLSIYSDTTPIKQLVLLC